jgi:hypothetical protein
MFLGSVHLLMFNKEHNISGQCPPSHTKKEHKVDEQHPLPYVYYKHQALVVNISYLVENTDFRRLDPIGPSGEWGADGIPLGSTEGAGQLIENNCFFTSQMIGVSFSRWNGIYPIWEALCYYRDTKILTDSRNQVILSRIRVLDMLMRI